MVGSGQFGKLLDKATSHLLMEPDLATTLTICDMIRQEDVAPKTAFNALKKKLQNTNNPHTILHALLVLESIVKNCPTVHDELSTRAFLDTLYELVKTTTHNNIRSKILELLQTWAQVFKTNSKFEALHDIVSQMKAEGFKFPALRESEAMFSSTNAPTWVDGGSCHRCRTPFSFINRKHHCRACGQVFCGECSQKTITLPKFGIEKEVRVCDSCYAEASKASISKSSSKTEELPYEYLKSSLYQQKQQPTKKTKDELQEEDDLRLALALSQSEAESKEKEKERAARMKSTSSPTYSSYKTEPSRPVDQQQEDDSVNPELAKYLNRSYWESRTPSSTTECARPTSPSAPAVSTIPLQNSDQKYKNKEDGMINNELEEFINTLRSQVEIFINRMKSNSSRGRSIANDTSVQTLFMNITAMHSKLLGYIKEHDDSRLHFEILQDKLAQVKDARAALDALREEHREKLRREAEEAEKLRQLQMAHKLDIMRKKKQEYLQYQRQLVLQRVQEQEREMQMRQEQQKQQALMGNQQYPMGYMVHGQQYPPNSAPPVGSYHQYGPPHNVMVGPGMMPGQTAHISTPQVAHMGGPPQGPMAQVQHQMHMPPGFNPVGSQNNVPSNAALQGPPIHNQDPGKQQMPPQAQMSQHIGMGYLPQQPVNNPAVMPMVQSSTHNASQGMIGPMPGVTPQQYSQQPGAPPASPQVPQQTPTQPSKQEEAQTAELISFD